MTQVFLVGSFNEWNTTSDEMVLRKTENNQNVFELYLELYSGLYYYKFYIPSQKSFVCDPMNPRRVSDSYGGYNSILEIPIQTHTKHPYLQSAQLKADTWWAVDEDADQVYRTVSYGNLGVLANPPVHGNPKASMKRVGPLARVEA